jgi:hypothetical protein
LAADLGGLLDAPGASQAKPQRRLRILLILMNAGVGSGFPALSIARTSKRVGPSRSRGIRKGVVHGLNGLPVARPLILQRKLEPSSVEISL